MNASKALRRGISPVIATVIIVAVTLAIAVAVVGWLVGLWGSIARGSPQIQVSGLSVIVKDNAFNVTFYVKNSGNAADKLTRVTVEYNGNLYECTSFSKGTTATSLSSTNVPIEIKAGEAYWISATCGNNVNAKVGDKVIVHIYFETSGEQNIPAVVEAIQSSSSSS